MPKENVGQPLPSPFVVKFNTVIGRDFTDPVYKHLEHDGYPIIFKQERERLMSANGITLQKLESDFGIRAFVRQLNITYKVPVMFAFPST